MTTPTLKHEHDTQGPRLLLAPRARLSFADFLESSPGLSAYARQMYLMIDAEAVRIGREIAASHNNPENLRELALQTLQAWAMAKDGIGRTWINWYAVMLSAYDEHAKAARLVP